MAFLMGSGNGRDVERKGEYCLRIVKGKKSNVLRW